MPLEYGIVPEVGGGLYTSSRNTAAGLNKPRWAKITDSAGTDPVRYAWEEQTFQALAPGGSVSIGFVKADAGITATVNLNPLIEPNDSALQIGDFVQVQAMYFDPLYDWVFTVFGGSGAGNSALHFAKCLNATPTSGRYDARLQNTETDGTFTDTGASVWLREGNSTPTLVLNEIYGCALTGNTLGRPVYTTVDFNATVRKKDLTSSQSRSLYFEFGPSERVTITRPGGADSRRTLVDYSGGIDIKDVRTGGVVAATYADVWVLELYSEPLPYDPTFGDYVFTWTAATHVLRVRLNGHTGSGFDLTDCTGGQLFHREKRFANGLLKEWLGRIPAPIT